MIFEKETTPSTKCLGAMLDNENVSRLTTYLSDLITTHLNDSGLIANMTYHDSKFIVKLPLQIGDGSI